MERHISSPREVRKGCDEGEEGRRSWRNVCGWWWYSVERKKGRQRLVVCCLVKEGQFKEHSGARSCDGGHEK